MVEIVDTNSLWIKKTDIWNKKSPGFKEPGDFLVN